MNYREVACIRDRVQGVVRQLGGDVSRGGVERNVVPFSMPDRYVHRNVLQPEAPILHLKGQGGDRALRPAAPTLRDDLLSVVFGALVVQQLKVPWRRPLQHLL